MRASTCIVAGVFCGATIEPGTFHFCNEPDPRCTGDIARHASDGLTERETDAAPIGTPANIRQMRSEAPGEETDGLIPPMEHFGIFNPGQW